MITSDRKFQRRSAAEIIRLLKEKDKNNYTTSVFCARHGISHQTLLKMKLQIQKFSQIIFGSKSERFIANPAQFSLDMAIDAVGATTKLPSGSQAGPPF